MNGYPKRRVEGLITKQLDGETLIYDLETHQATCLNALAEAVLNDCDGALSVQALGEIHGVEAANAALRKLSKAGLLQKGYAAPKGPNRREAMRQIAGGARLAAVAAAPVVATISVPTAAQAASCKLAGDACVASSECCSASCGFFTAGICD